MGAQRPRTVTRAMQAMLAVVVSGASTVVLIWFLRNSLILSWAEGNDAAREVLEQGGLSGLEESSLHIPALVPVAVVMFLVFTVLVAVLTMFLRDGHEWARLSLTVLMGLTALGWLAWLRTVPPAPFPGLAVLGVALDIVAVFFLGHRDTVAFARGAWHAAAPEEALAPEAPGAEAAPGT